MVMAQATNTQSTMEPDSDMNVDASFTPLNMLMTETDGDSGRFSQALKMRAIKTCKVQFKRSRIHVYATSFSQPLKTGL